MERKLMSGQIIQTNNINICLNRCANIVKTNAVHNYLMKRTESPALSRFAPTNILQPVVSRCRLGCPKWERKSQIFKIQSKGKFQIFKKIQMSKHSTSVYVTKSPGILVQITDNKFLRGRLHWVILKWTLWRSDDAITVVTYHKLYGIQSQYKYRWTYSKRN